MDDKSFEDLKLRMTIVPRQVRWPDPEYLHWQRLHEAADETRERVSQAYAQMDEIDRNDLSRDGKYRERRKTAAQAIADFEASRMLARAREAVELAVAKHDTKPEAKDAMLKAMKEAQKGWNRAMDKIGERASTRR